MRLFIAALISFFSISSFAEESRRVWDGDPLTLVLPVGKEVRVTFPTDVNLQVPIDLSQALESLAPNQRVVYWKAIAPFDSSRVIATSTDGSTVYLLDLTATNDAPEASVFIEDPDRIANSTPSHNTEEDRNSIEQKLSDPAEIVLTRFASQTLYAPTRLVPMNPNIFPVKGVAIPQDFPLLVSQKGESYRVDVVGAWTGYGRYVTAVLVVNLGNVGVPINPALVRGNFTHITPQHTYVRRSGALEDRTTLYLISEEPFGVALLEDGYGY